MIRREGAMRVYTHFQKNIFTTFQDIEKYQFFIDAGRVEDYEQWSLLDITFYDYEKEKENRTLFRIYIYHFREGGKAIDVNCEVKQNQIVLEFVPSFDALAQKLENNEDFENKFLLNIINLLRNSFQGRRYRPNETDLFAVIKKLESNHENRHLQRELLRLKGENKGLILIGGIAMVGLFLLIKKYLRR